MPTSGVRTSLKCNAAEARWLTGEPDASVDGAAEALLRLGPELVVVTDGTAPAIARGAVRAAVIPPPVDVVSPLGAGDAFMGALAAGLHATGFELEPGRGGSAGRGGRCRPDLHPPRSLHAR